MIYLTRLNGERIILNIDLIEFMETTPDTVVTLTTGRKFLVREKIPDILVLIDKAREKRSLCYRN